MYSITLALQGQFQLRSSLSCPPLSWSRFCCPAPAPTASPRLALLAAQLTLPCTLDCSDLLTEKDLIEGGCNGEFGRESRSMENLQVADAEGTDEDGNVERSGEADGTSRGMSAMKENCRVGLRS